MGYTLLSHSVLCQGHITFYHVSTKTNVEVQCCGLTKLMIHDEISKKNWSHLRLTLGKENEG